MCLKKEFGKIHSTKAKTFKELIAVQINAFLKLFLFKIVATINDL